MKQTDPHLEEVNQNIEPKTPDMVVRSVCRWVLIRYNCGFVYHVVTKVVVTLLLISMQQNISN
jgi:hypothetical protein